MNEAERMLHLSVILSTGRVSKSYLCKLEVGRLQVYWGSGFHWLIITSIVTVTLLFVVVAKTRSYRSQDAT